MVSGCFSRFILVHWTHLILQYANNMVLGSFFRFILVQWTRPIQNMLITLSPAVSLVSL